MFANSLTRKWAIAIIIALVSSLLLRSHAAMGQEEALRETLVTQIAVDEDILAAFVDEPCRHFEAARDKFILGENQQVAQHLRIGSAFLQLESARARADGKLALKASVSELQSLADAVENNQVQTVQVLQQAFARAHYALAGHHCINSAHRCCRPATFQDKQELARTGWDLKAAAIHLNRGALWAGGELDEETRNLIAGGQLTADQLIRQDIGSQSDVQHTIHALHGKLEKISGLKIMLAQPLPPEEDKSGFSNFR